MGELLFWVGEDKMLFGSDYGIWEPKWQIEGFLDWDYPDERAFSDYPRVNDADKRKILGLNAAKLYGIEVPAELQLPDGRDAGSEGGRAAGRVGMTAVGADARVLDALAGVYDPELDEPITIAAVRERRARCPRTAMSRLRCGCRRRSARPISRS